MKAHSGHLDDSGVQRHSCGELYPWSIKVIGGEKPGEGFCQAWHTGTGEELTAWAFTKHGPAFGSTFKQAHSSAEREARRVINVKRVAAESKAARTCDDCGQEWINEIGAKDCCTLPEHWQTSVRQIRRETLKSVEDIDFDTLWKAHDELIKTIKAKLQAV